MTRYPQQANPFLQQPIDIFTCSQDAYFEDVRCLHEDLLNILHAHRRDDNALCCSSSVNRCCSLMNQISPSVSMRCVGYVLISIGHVSIRSADERGLVEDQFRHVGDVRCCLLEFSQHRIVNLQTKVMYRNSVKDVFVLMKAIVSCAK